MELGFFEICVYGPPPVLTKTNLREFLFWGFSEFYVPKVWKSVLQLSHHFVGMVRQPNSTLLSLTELLRVPKRYLGCFDSKSHHDHHYFSGDEVAKSDGILKFSKVVRPTRG